MNISPIIRESESFADPESHCFITRGEGTWLYDSDGRRYLDLCGGLWNTPFGYGEPHIKERVAEQMERLPYCNLVSFISELQYNYARRLADFTGMCSVLYTCSGSEAVEGAVKVARQHRKTGGSAAFGITAMNLSYHGTSYAALSVSGTCRVLTDPYTPMLSGIQWYTVPENIRDVDAWMDITEKHFEKYGNEMAGFVLEPVLASGGLVEVPDPVIRRIAELCRKYGVLLIDDEISTGFGRTGEMFIYRRAGVKPDLLCLSKAINNGFLPLGAVLFSREIAEDFLKNNETVVHFSTQAGNLLSLAAADATLDLLEGYEQYHVKEKGEKFRLRLRENLAGIEGMDVRGQGLMDGFAFPKGSGSGEKLAQLRKRLRSKGIAGYHFYNPGFNQGLSFFPAFTMSEEELVKAADRITDQVFRVYGF